MRLLMLGAPGSGKGTHGVRIAERYGVPHISTGDLLRAHVAGGTKLGQRAQAYMERGDLAPDLLIFALILDRLVDEDAAKGFVLDGFPRTLGQAQAAYGIARETEMIFDTVLFLEIPHEELMRRLEERGRDSGRTDDTEATIRHRIEVYEEKTLPLLDYYEQRGVLQRIDAVGSIDEVSDRIFTALESLRPSTAVVA